MAAFFATPWAVEISASTDTDPIATASATPIVTSDAIAGGAPRATAKKDQNNTTASRISPARG